jgi:hypothetical protein
MDQMFSKCNVFINVTYLSQSNGGQVKIPCCNLFLISVFARQNHSGLVLRQNKKRASWGHLRTERNWMILVSEAGFSIGANQSTPPVQSNCSKPEWKVRELARNPRLGKIHWIPHCQVWLRR